MADQYETIATIMRVLLVVTAALVLLGLMASSFPTNPTWTYRNDDELPTKEGWYRVMISGDSESMDGHTIYEYPDYETWAYFTPDEEGGTFTGTHDEETEMVFAYFGPVSFPKYDA